MNNTNDSMLSQLYTYDTAIHDYHAPVISKPIHGQPTVPIKIFSDLSRSDSAIDLREVFFEEPVRRQILISIPSSSLLIV